MKVVFGFVCVFSPLRNRSGGGFCSGRKGLKIKHAAAAIVCRLFSSFFALFFFRLFFFAVSWILDSRFSILDYYGFSILKYRIDLELYSVD